MAARMSRITNRDLSPHRVTNREPSPIRRRNTGGGFTTPSPLPAEARSSAIRSTHRFTDGSASSTQTPATTSRLTVTRLLEQQTQLQQTADRIESVLSDIQESAISGYTRKKKLPRELCVSHKHNIERSVTLTMLKLGLGSRGVS